MPVQTVEKMIKRKLVGVFLLFSFCKTKKFHDTTKRTKMPTELSYIKRYVCSKDVEKPSEWNVALGLGEKIDLPYLFMI